MLGTAQARRRAAARELFLSTQGWGPSDDVALAEISSAVIASWRRSRAHGVDAHRWTAEHHDVDRDSRLLRCADPVLAELEDDLRGSHVSVALTDEESRIVSRGDCSAQIARALDRIDFDLGFSFREAGVGTNGIGTAVEAGGAIAVVGDDHYSDALTPFACVGYPIHDPGTGRCAGVLDLTTFASSWSPALAALVRGAAARIGERLLHDRGAAHQRLFDAYAATCLRTHDGVIAVGAVPGRMPGGGGTVLMDDTVQRDLSDGELRAVLDHARMRGESPRRRSDTLDPEGRRLAIRMRPVDPDDPSAGVVMTIRAAAESCAPASGSGRTAVEIAYEEAAEAVRDRHPLLVLGEPGAGRFTMAYSLLRRHWPPDRISVLAASEIGHGRLIEAGTAAVLVRDLEQLSATACARLSSEGALPGVDLAEGAVLLVGTATEVVALPPPVVAAFTRSVTVAPLRHRARADVTGVAADLIRELAPERRVRLSPQAQRALGRYIWPGNTAQLREALAHALSRRPVGEIRPGDLPGWCRTSSPRTLTPIETAERDTIVAALDSSGGNRVHAARALGMSRSSLYRKIARYSIDG